MNNKIILFSKICDEFPNGGLHLVWIGHKDSQMEIRGSLMLTIENIENLNKMDFFLDKAENIWCNVDSTGVTPPNLLNYSVYMYI
jgi:hypothetical protein